MPQAITEITVLGNSPGVISAICSNHSNKNINFSNKYLLHKSRFQIYVLNLGQGLEDVSQSLISLYSNCHENNTKLVVCLLFDGEISKDKVIYFQKLLDDLGVKKPLHRLVIARDLYTSGKTTPITALDEEINRIFTQTGIKISTKGNNYLYPLSIKDFLEAVTKILFLDSTTGKTFYLQGDPIKDLELAYLIKNMISDDLPDFQINSLSEDLPENSEMNNLSNSTQASLNWRPKQEFKDYLKQAYQNRYEDSGEYQPDDPKPNRLPLQILSKIKTGLIKRRILKGSTTKKKYRKLGIALIFVAACYLSVCLTFAFSVYQSFNLLASSLESLRQGNLTDSRKYIGKTIIYDKIATEIYWPIKPLLEVISKTADEELNSLFSFNQYLRNSLENLQQAYVLSDKVFKSFVDNSASISIEDQSLAIKSSLGQVYDNLTQINIMLNSGKLPQSLKTAIQKSTKYKQLGELGDQLSQAMKLINILPVLSASEKTKTIGLIVQDKRQLRSLGGVITHLIVLIFDKGKMTNYKVYKSIEVDNQDGTTVPSPTIIFGLTGDKTWEFRDMSYLGDFSQTAQYLSSYLEKNIQIKPDILIALDSSFLHKIIDNQDSDTKTTVNEDIDKIAKTIINLYQDQKINLALLADTVLRELDLGNLSIWVSDPDIQAGLVNLPFSGVIAPHTCHNSLGEYPACITETTYLTESSFTDSLINQYISREVTHFVTLKPGETIHEYHIKYHFLENVSPSIGSYRYVYQLHSPENSQITSIYIDDQELQTETFSKQTINKLNYFQIPLALSLNQDHQVKITFSSATNTSLDWSKTAYSLTEMRQPGINDLGYIVVINLPENTHAAILTNDVDIKPQQIFLRLPQKTSTFGLGLGRNRQ